MSRRVSLACLTGLSLLAVGSAPRAQAIQPFDYRIIATTKTSTMEKTWGDQGFEALAMTVGKTAIGGSELVTVMRKLVR